MASVKTFGKCGSCGKELVNATMGRHLARCLGAGPALHLAFDVGPGTWWLHLAVLPSATLGDVDDFLRGTWLECCWHMSAFETAAGRYTSGDRHEDLGWGPPTRTMAAKAATALPLRTTFRHEYDFGSPTELRGRVLGNVAGGRAEVTLLARNEPIDWVCGGCGGSATRVCPQCFAFRCDACVVACECGPYVVEPLPVVNSPRMGVCGYCG